MFSIVYLVVAFIFMAFCFWQSAGDEDFNDLDDNGEKAKSALIFLSAFWPLSILLFCILFLWEKFRNRITKKVRALIDQYAQIDAPQLSEDEREDREAYLSRAIKKMSIKELQYLLFAQKVKAIDLTENAKNLVERLLSDKAFEQEVLKDG